MGIDVRTIDPADREALHGFWAAGAAAEADHVLATWPTWETAAAAWPAPRTDSDRRFLTGAVDDRVVGGALLDLPLADNAHLAMLSLVVDPEHRGHGVGATVLAEVERQAREAGRTALLAWVVQPPTASSAGERFAAAHGFETANRAEAKAVDLAATAGTWPALAASAQEAMDGYRLEVWEGPTPAARVDDVCALFSALFSEIPLGDVDLEPQQWDEARLRESERRREDGGIRSLMVVAVGPGGGCVGYSECVHESRRPDPAELTSTLVLPEHRGHRLGLAMKVRLHTELHARHPDCRRLVTSNATSNAQMSDVNARLGYVVLEEVLEVQKRLD